MKKALNIAVALVLIAVSVFLLAGMLGAVFAEEVGTDETAVPEDSACSGFTDLDPEAWYYRSVESALEIGLFSGTSETTFSPNADMTRGMLVTVLYRYMGAPKPNWPNAFQDIPSGKWFTNGVLWANENDFAAGTSATTFGPYGAITREQLICMLYRFAETQAFAGAEPGDLSKYEDADEIAGYAVDAMAWAVGNEIISGTGVARLSPKKTATRAQVATILMRLIRRMQEQQTDHVHAFVLQNNLCQRSAQSCKMDETYWYTCACGARSTSAFYSTLPALGHVMQTQTKAPTCMQSGYEIRKCTRCGYVEHAETKPALGHSYTQTTVAPTMTADGYTEYTCQRCGYSYRDILPALIPNVENPIVSSDEISAACSKYSISRDSDLFKAIVSINTVYAAKLTAAQKNQPMLFVFDGCGADLTAGKRFGAAGVVVKNGKIVYLNLYCSTVPDWPFSPAMNNNRQPMPIIKSGIYKVTATNQYSAAGYYAAWYVNDCKVVRFRSKTDYYSSTSSGINVHRRTTDEIVPYGSNWVNACGCILIGKSGKTASSDYAKFIAAVGLVPSGSSASTMYKTNVTGVLIVDRTYAKSYLKAIGYTDGAINLIG